MILNPDRLLKLIGEMLREMRDSMNKSIDHKLELARVNADLRIEQAHSTIKTLLDMHDRFEELIESLQEQLKAAQQENARLVEAYEKAVAERLEHRGPFKSGETYRRNQMTTRDGSTFICVADETGDDPRDKEAKGWRLLAMRGERGPAGATGTKGDRGEKGEKGEQGRPGVVGPAGQKGERGPRGEPGVPGKHGPAGVDGVSPVAADLVGKKLVLTLSDGEMLRVDLGKLFKGDA